MHSSTSAEATTSESAASDATASEATPSEAATSSSSATDDSSTSGALRRVTGETGGGDSMSANCSEGDDESLSESVPSDENESASLWSAWWHGDGGAAQLLLIAVPLIISTISFTIMQFCDRMFLAWYSTDAMAAVMPAGTLCWTMFSLPMGIAGFAGTFIAQYLGAGRASRVGPILWQAHRIGLYAVPSFIGLAILSPMVFQRFGHSESMVWLEVVYFQAISLGAGAIVFGAGLGAFFIGRGRTSEIMVVDSIAAAANILLDYLMIFGVGPFPELGIEGAAWATSLAMWFKVALLAFLVYRPKHIADYRLLDGRNWRPDLLLRLLRFGAPNGLQFVIEGSAITLFILFIGRLGSEAAAATTLAFSVNMLAFFPIFGLGMAVTTVVGQQLGKKEPRFAARATWTGQVIAVGYTLIFALLYFFWPNLFISAFGQGTQDLDAIRQTSELLLKFVAAYCIFDAIQLVFVSALKGAGDTWFVLLATLGVAAILVFGGWFGFRQFSSLTGELNWWWLTISGWVWSMAIVFGIRFFQGKWRSMSVIEPELIAVSSPEEQEVVAI